MAAAGGSGSGSGRRIAFFGTHPKQFNGYSKVVYELSKAFVALGAQRPEYARDELHVFGFQNFFNHPGHRTDTPFEVVLHDAHSNETPKAQGFGFSHARAYVERVRPDVCVVFNDLMVLTNILGELQQASNRADFKVVAYIDQVYLSQRRDLLELVDRHADAAIAFTPEWRECIVWQGLRLPCHVLVHGFNAATYFPIPRKLVRGFFGVSEDDFLVLNLNRNQPRKRWDTCMQAFAEVVARRPQANIKLVIATETKGAWDLMELLLRELRKRGFDEARSRELAAARVVVPGHPQMLTDAETNVLYNLADIGINTCDGEGFGLCNFEQAAIGIPQVVPRIGGFRHFFDDGCALMVDPVTSIYVDATRDSVGGEAELSRSSDFADAILRYYDSPALRAAHGAAARQRITESFTWARVASDFVGIVDAVCPPRAAAAVAAPAPPPSAGSPPLATDVDALQSLLELRAPPSAAAAPQQPQPQPQPQAFAPEDEFAFAPAPAAAPPAAVPVAPPAAAADIKAEVQALQARLAELMASL
jgi:glycosyltransferase involved in cell wall biosynthesis